MNNKLKITALLAGDIAILYASLYLTLLIRYFQPPSSNVWQEHFWPFTLAFTAWLIIFYISGLYNLHSAVNNLRFLNSVFKSIAVAGLLSVVVFYANPNINISPKTNLVVYIFVFATLFIFWRRIYNWLIYARLPKENLIFIGFNPQVEEITAILKAKPHLGCRVAQIMSEEKISNPVAPVSNDLKSLKKIILEKNISTVILSEKPHYSAELRSVLFDCLPCRVNILNLSDFYESITGKIPQAAINQMWFLENLSRGRKTGFDLFKRIYDFLLAGFILLITVPFWPLIGLFIKLESRGPVFFRQTRVGQDNRHFTIVKFRTMHVKNNDHSPTAARDKRITRFGGFWRKTRIDELPQLINILKGQMSFVGPRPERPELACELAREIPFYRERTLVKPGLTGWDQISGEYHSPSQEDTIKKLQYDLFYIKNRSILLDLSIILKTIATILSRSGM